MAIEPVGPIFEYGPPWTILPAMASGNHQRPEDQLSKPFPQPNGNSFIPPCTPYSSLQEWCIYGLNSTIPKFQIKVPKSNAHFEGGFFNSSVWQSMAAIRRSFKDPNHLALQDLGWQVHSGLFQRHSQRLYSFSISCQGINYFNTPWITQLVHIGVNQSTCMSLAQLGQFILTLWEFNHTVQFQDFQNCISPIQTIQPVIHLPGSVFQFFTYTGHLSAPGDFFPS
ncbi:hypothetical protein O181_021565 [Austropuccinia psidii MF-1]|uniref:Uncharacterized protein n=1 Tax=Austropuccinia psidii MF-1 TaxID=1389203 RepID=A0A9Q3CEU9_9BASI|nr:hypothetical protein [Austropuccinia psidii MF-1]